jgi:hypothetical protein
MFLVFSLGCDMNTVFALMIVTAMGVTEAPNNFTTMQACQSASAKIKADSYCVEKKPVNVEKEMASMMRLMMNMVKTMDTELKQ